MSRPSDPPDPPDRAGGTKSTQLGSPDGEKPDHFVATGMAAARLEDPPEHVILQAIAQETRLQDFTRLAEGGMGVVYKAYDPSLARMVAVKLVRVPGGDPSRARREGQVLAQLDHVNVVKIHRDGFVGDRHLYFVMELVLGPTLRVWVKGSPDDGPKKQGEIVAAYAQAGEALAAAHASGLVHRDFKPENAIMGPDGRVRVIDFGLAVEASDPSRPETPKQPRAGTPPYMAPEQKEGRAITAATDQYGFCKSLAEALEGAGRAPLPRWIQAVVDRGLAEEPANRFPTMRDLLKALARDPARLRRKWIASASVAAAGIVAFVAGRATFDARAAACDGGEAQIASVWGGEGRPAALARLAGLGDYGRSVQPRLEAELRQHQSRWAAGYRSACVAHNDGTQSGAMLDRRMACLDRGRAALTSMAEIVRTTDAKALPDLVLAARSLPDPDACGDLDSLLTNVDPPATAIAPRVAAVRSQLAGTRVQLAAGRYRQARAAAEQAVSDARALAYPPLIAEALLLAGHAMMAMDDRLAATAPLTEAYTLAFQAGDQSLAVEAWARRAWLQGTVSGGSASLAGLDVVQAAAEHRSVSHFARALFYNNVGSVLGTLDQRERAQAAYERALREAEGVTGPGAAELLIIRRNLGISTDDPERRDRILAEAVAEAARVLGNDHPDTVAARWVRGVYSVRFARTLEILTPTCPSLEPSKDALARRCWWELGYVLGELNDPTGAAGALRRAAGIQVKLEVGLTAVLPYLHFWQGQAVIAAREFATALEAFPLRDDEPWWARLDRADLELGQARVDRAGGNLHRARRSLEVALRRLVDIDGKDPYPGIDRRLGRARAELAKVLAAAHAPPRAIAESAAPAAAWLRQAGGLESEIAELDRLAKSDGVLAGRSHSLQ